jgi:predicted regulator of Ras-like GTPase activity (Roadblock/LC7/MglB family)
MSFPSAQMVLEDLVGRVTGALGAILADQAGIPIAQVCRPVDLGLRAIGDRCTHLLRETIATADRLGQGAVMEVVLEAERATIAMVPLKNSHCLCLLLDPEASVGRGLFEARRAAFALDQAP